MARTAIRAVLTDLDGVIRDWSGQDDAAIERAHGLPAGAITGVAFDPDLVTPAITGRLSDAAWRRRAVEVLRERHPDGDAEGAMAAWSAPAGAIDAAVLATIQAVRGQVPVVLVTNATDRLPIDLATLGVLDAFDYIVNSSVIGAAKPDAAIYRHALEVVGVTGAAVFYVDDQAGYLAAAAALGIVTHHFRGAEGLRAALAGHGLLG